MNFSHQPVLLEESIDFLNCCSGGIYLDGTLGRGGHTAAILQAIEDEGLVIGLDRDRAAIKAAAEKLKNYKSFKPVHSNFVEIPGVLADLGIEQVDGMLFDLGVSSPQFDNPERGFSYRHEAELDMRMNQQQSLTAGQIVNQASREELTRIIGEYGEEKWASRIAGFIVDFRRRSPIRMTGELVEVIKAAIPASARRKGGHPARRTFQALRIATNNELQQLEEMIEKAVPFIKPGGRICIISFHSLEDRIVKRSFRELARDCVCPRDFPVCVCDHEAQVSVITRKPVQASPEEIAENPRARSAKLRVAEKL